MVIGIDIDGVLADFNKAFIERCVLVTGQDLFPAGYEPLTWNYPESLGYSGEEVTAVWKTIKGDPHFWETLPNYDTTIDDLIQLGNLRLQGHDVYYITNRMGVRAKEQTEFWLKHRWVYNPTVLLTPHKGLAAQALSLDYYIDDRDLNVIDVSQTKTKTFLMDRPWNQEVKVENYGVARVKSVAAMFTGVCIDSRCNA